MRSDSRHARSRILCLPLIRNENHHKGNAQAQSADGKEVRCMIYAIAIILVLFLVFGNAEWLLSVSLVEQMAYHHFFHGNIFHLAANLFAGYFVFKRWETWHLAAAYLIGSLSFLCSPIPAIGFSNIIYAMIGLKSPHFKHAWWRHPGTITFLVVTLLMALIPNVSAITHIVSFCGGVIIAILSRRFQRIKNDSARYI